MLSVDSFGYLISTFQYELRQGVNLYFKWRESLRRWHQEHFNGNVAVKEKVCSSFPEHEWSICNQKVYFITQDKLTGKQATIFINFLTAVAMSRDVDGVQIQTLVIYLACYSHEYYRHTRVSTNDASRLQMRLWDLWVKCKCKTSVSLAYSEDLYIWPGGLWTGQISAWKLQKLNCVFGDNSFDFWDI